MGVDEHFSPRIYIDDDVFVEVNGVRRGVKCGLESE